MKIDQKKEKYLRKEISDSRFKILKEYIMNILKSEQEQMRSEGIRLEHRVSWILQVTIIGSTIKIFKNL